MLDLAGRQPLVELARPTGMPLLLDETLVELGLDGPAPPPVDAHGGEDSSLVLSVGSVSKVFWGGLRVGWIRTSASMVRRLAALRASTDVGGPVLEQLVTTRLLVDVDAIAAARRPSPAARRPSPVARRTELTAARDHLLGRLSDVFGWWRPSRPGGGLSLWVDLGEPVSSRLTSAARRHDVLLAAGPRFGLDGAFERRLRLPFTLRRHRMDDAPERLAAAWQDLDHMTPAAEAEPIAVA